MLKTTNFINYDGPVIGVGAANVFPLLTPALFLKNYSMMSIKKRKDLDLIKKDLNVFCLEEEDPKHSQVSRSNLVELLKRESARDYILSFGKPMIFARKSAFGVQEFCDKNELKLLGNRKDNRDIYENKLTFRKILESIGVSPIPADVISYKDITWDKVARLKNKYGKRIVLQAAELIYGGGAGTAFVESNEDFDNYINRMQKIRNHPEVPRKIENIIVAQFINGVPSSVIGCATRYGVIIGSVQTQLQDIPDVSFDGKGSGVYCGHDWSYKRYPDGILLQVRQITQKFGDYIFQKGYRGIFGLDLLIDGENLKVYPVECNPRYTDALPVFSQLAQKEGIETLEYYHFLEHMGVSYKLDVNKLSEKYSDGFEGSQILLMSKFDKPSQNFGELDAGIYKFENGEIIFQRPSYNLLDIRTNNEFLLTDGVPYKFTCYKRIARIMRVIFPSTILAEDKLLKPEISEIIREIYNKLDLRKLNN